jgi:PAS domain S-box-containing protein
VDDESQGKGSLEPVTAGSPPAAARPRPSTRAFLVPVVVFVGLAVLAAVVGAVLYSRQAAEVRTRQGAQLTAVRDLKSDEITRWMDDQRADAALISGDGLLGGALERWIKRGHATPAPPTVRQILVTYRVGHAYSRIVVLDPQIEPVFASPARGPALGLATLTLARRALREDRVVFSDLFLDERGRPMMEFLAPVRDLTPSPRARLGVYVLQIVPATFLFPLIQTWPTPSETAETLLVEKRGGRVVYLNDLRHRDDAALKLAAPPSADERPAMLAAQGRRGVVAGLDYRGVRVLASVAPVGGTPWYLVAKIDRSEVDASLRSTALSVLGVVVGVILLAGLLLVLFWGRREGRQLRQLYEAERELRASEQRFKTAFDHAPVGVSLTLPDGRVGHPNATFAEMLGYSVAELEGLTVAEITHPDDRAETARLIEAALAGEIDGFKVDRRYLRKDGSDLWATVSVTLLRDELGRPVHFVAMISDISARKAAECALRESEARFRGLFESSLSGFALHEIVLDESGAPVDYVYVEANRAFYELTGLDAAHVVGRRASEVFADLPEPPYLEIYGETALGGQTHRFETYFEPLDRHFDMQVYSPQPGQFATGFVDVTERMRAQRTLEAFFDSQSVGLGILDRDLRYVRVNETLADINQVSVADHLGRTFQDVLPDHGASIVPVLERALQGEEVDGLEVSGGTTCEPGVEHHWLASYFPVAGEGGSVEAIGLVAIDVTGRRDAERELAEMNVDLEWRVLERTLQLEGANKELEAFSYSASHDLRAPLRALDGFSLALLEDYGEQLDDTGKDYLARLRAAAQRMGQLIDDLLMLSRVTRREMVREKVDLSALARDILADLREAESERAVDAAVADGLLANGDPALLRIVLQNLLANAWKFTSRKPEAHIEVGVDRRDGVAAYYVRDDGAGFDATYVDKLFTPFQRLHAAAEFPGTGIGLATVKRIVRRHGGTVWAEGAVDSGATFYFTLH